MKYLLFMWAITSYNSYDFETITSYAFNLNSKQECIISRDSYRGKVLKLADSEIRFVAFCLSQEE